MDSLYSGASIRTSLLALFLIVPSQGHRTVLCSCAVADDVHACLGGGKGTCLDGP